MTKKNGIELLGREIKDGEIVGYDIGNGKRFEIKANIFDDDDNVWFGCEEYDYVYSDSEMQDSDLVELEITKTKYKITKIQLYDYATKHEIEDEPFEEVVYSYSANVVINDTFIVQVHGDSEESTIDGICHSTNCYWNTEENQDNAFDNVENSIVIEAIEKAGFENNIWWLEENSETMNPENKQYRK